MHLGDIWQVRMEPEDRERGAIEEEWDGRPMLIDRADEVDRVHR